MRKDGRKTVNYYFGPVIGADVDEVTPETEL
jgi:hypothetical protein